MDAIVYTVETNNDLEHGIMHHPPTRDTAEAPSPRDDSQAPVERGPTVLVVDDSETGRSGLATLLKDSCIAAETLLAEDGLQALRILHAQPVDIVLCDMHMPRCDGINFLRLKAASPQLDTVPVVMLTGAEDMTSKVQALTCGASDYVTKPFDVTELVARITVHVRLRNVQAELRAANAELVRLTRTDPLTGVGNRRHFDLVLEDEFLRSRRYDRPFSVCMVDLDHFKRVNDLYGHAAGDAVLVAVARVCKSALRRCDTVARFGGEEFALILPETPAEGAWLAVDRLRQAIARESIPHGESTLSITASVGVATFPHALVNHAADLTALADAALYDAKRSGRNCVAVAV